MKFIKMGDKYLIAGSNGKIIDEKEKLELENQGLIMEDITSNKCQSETTKKVKNNRKKIKELEDKTVEETEKTL